MFTTEWHWWVSCRFKWTTKRSQGKKEEKTKQGKVWVKTNTWTKLWSHSEKHSEKRGSTYAWEFCFVVQTLSKVFYKCDVSGSQRLSPTSLTPPLPPHICSWGDGTLIRRRALFIPQSVWLKPPEHCKERSHQEKKNPSSWDNIYVYHLPGWLLS